jgi:hypothetical protein
MAHEIATVTTCRLCHKKFIGPAGDGLLLGAAPTSARFLMELTQHMVKEHASVHQTLAVRAMEFLGFLLLRNYLSVDEALMAQMDRLRWHVHQETLAVRIPDENLVTQSRQFASDLIEGMKANSRGYDENGGPFVEEVELLEFIAGEVQELATGFRDVYQEPGKYPAAEAAIPLKMTN